MTPERKKTVLIIAGTLIIGIVIGALLTGMFARQHYRGERSARGRDMGKGGRQGFASRLIRLVQADSTQVPLLKPVIEETMTRIDAIQGRSREEVRHVIDSMEVKLQPILRPDQMDRLKKFHTERRKERERMERKR